MARRGLGARPRASRSRPSSALATACLVLAAFAVPARAELSCRVDPFARPSASEGERWLFDACRGEEVQWKLETPRAHPEDAGPGVVQAEVASALSRRLAPGLLGSVGFGAGARRVEGEPERRDDHALLAAGTSWRLSPQWALQLQLGRQASEGLRSRATATTLWQPLAGTLAWAQWIEAGEGSEAQQRFGARCWLLGRRLAIDVGAMHAPEGAGLIDRRIALTLALRP